MLRKQFHAESSVFYFTKLIIIHVMNDSGMAIDVLIQM